ncbi:unnamed protein product, partial [Mesorhabditis belari]|uniref:Uncharacterized protein n=1 Tax=Mesorhabditis belari TaxID=2138241 RepID=A0AAF3E8Z3_9BILA
MTTIAAGVRMRKRIANTMQMILRFEDGSCSFSLAAIAKQQQPGKTECEKEQTSLTRVSPPGTIKANEKLSPRSLLAFCEEARPKDTLTVPGGETRVRELSVVDILGDGYNEELPPRRVTPIFHQPQAQPQRDLNRSRSQIDHQIAFISSPLSVARFAIIEKYVA